MRKPPVIIISVLVCLLVISVFVAFSWPSASLGYEGRHLSEWLLLVQSSSQQEREHAEQAVREIGVNTLPFLEELVENAHFDSVKVKVSKWVHREEFPVHEIRRMVFNGYGSLGEIAKPSVPFLLEMLKDGEPTVTITGDPSVGATTRISEAPSSSPVAAPDSSGCSYQFSGSTST